MSTNPSCGVSGAHGFHPFFSHELNAVDYCYGLDKLVNIPFERECDIDRCALTGTHLWEGLLDARFSLVIHTKARFLLCDGHDRFFQENLDRHSSRPLLDEPEYP